VQKLRKLCAFFAHFLRVFSSKNCANFTPFFVQKLCSKLCAFFARFLRVFSSKNCANFTPFFVQKLRKLCAFFASNHTSNFDQEHPLYSMTNQCKLGKFKSETGSTLPLQAAAKCIHYTHLREPDRFARPRACRKPMAFFARKLCTHTHTQLCNLPCMQRNEIVAGWQQQQQQHAGHCMVMATAGGRSTMLHKDVHARAWVLQNKQQQND